MRVFGNNNAYVTEAVTLLKPLLQNLTQNGSIQRPEAEAIYDARNNWVPNFVSALPANVTEQQFKQGLLEAVKKLVALARQPQQTNMFSGGGGMFNGGGSNLFSNGGGGSMFDQGGPMLDHNTQSNDPQPVSESSLFGGGTAASKLKAKEPANIEMQFEPYKPVWGSRISEYLDTYTNAETKVGLISNTFAGDDTHSAIDLIELITQKCFMNHDEVALYVNSLWGNENYVAHVKHKRAYVINGDSAMVEELINKIKTIDDSRPKEALLKVIGLLDGCTRGVHKVFSPIIVDEMNKHVAPGGIQDSSKIKLPITVTDIDGVEALINASTNQQIVNALTAGSFGEVDRAIEGVCASIISKLKTITVTTDHNAIACGLRSSEISMPRHIPLAVANEDTAITSEYMDGRVCITYETWTFLTNCNPSESYLITKAFNDKAPAHCVDDSVLTCGLDIITVKYLIANSPEPCIFNIVGSDMKVAYGVSTDSKRYVKVIT